MRERTSILANKDILNEAVNKSDSIRDVLIYLGLRSAGGNYSALKNYAKLYDIKLPDGNILRIKKLNETIKKNRYKIENILTENSNFNRGSLKRRILDLGLLKNICSVCGLPPIWNNKPISLQIDHINGIYNDNRIDNLRIICPNCHSQTRTFSGNNRKRKNIKRKKKTELEKKFIYLKQKKLFITKEELEKIIWEKPTEIIGKEHKVSGKCIEKYCKKWNIAKPPRGYWAKKYAGKINS